MKDLGQFLIGLTLIIISSYLSFKIPITETGIPFTFQSLMVFIIAGLMKPRHFIYVLLAYLLIGICGAPVFADGSSGLSKITGASGGFLYGFLISGYFISKSILSKKDVQIIDLLIIMLIATTILFFFGLLQLTMIFGFQKAIQYGLEPFWIMAIVKALLATMVVFIIIRKFRPN